ncbi:MAG: dihydrolipoyllysine-residue succinyltransferase, partial [Deltaproteobacteria bacterium]|nr:dihydrolipoyllysine-residue succinyltransferase [Deltaproteobacteria bacterium]
MMSNIIAPNVGESITVVSILKWLKQDGQFVTSGELLLEIESDKATVELVAPSTGVLKILKQNGEKVPIGEIIGTVDDAANPSPTHLAPSARKAALEKKIDPTLIAGTGKDGRVTKGDVLQFTQPATVQPIMKGASIQANIYERRVAMSTLRSRIAERLVQAQQTAAILTTFNEIDMSKVIALRNKEKENFKAKHGVALSFMSFFTKASVEGLKVVPEINAYVEDNTIIYHDYYDIGIAVGTDRGLVVPVLRDVEKINFVEMEKTLTELAVKAREGKLSIPEMTGGTFTISNGGVYGSLLSTPILNPPQSGILGMHKIEERPVAISGKIEIKPMMYVALSYDHRIVDGKGAVTFLV